MNKYKVKYKRLEKSYGVTGMVFIEAYSHEDVHKKFHHELNLRLVSNFQNCEIVNISEIEISKDCHKVKIEQKSNGNDPFSSAIPGTSEDAINQWCQWILSFYGTESKTKINEYLGEIRI